MDHSPKKSKALIITILAVIVLLVISYFLFFQNNQLFGIKSTSDTSGQSNAATNIKNFVALLFKPKTAQTTTSPVNDTTATGSSSTLGNGSTTATDANTNTGATNGTTDTTNTTSGTFGAGNGTDTRGGFNSSGGLGVNTGSTGVSGFGSGSYGPALTPLPTPTNTTATTSNQTNTVPQCSDGIDNNGNGLIDIKDPACHTDFNAQNITSYDPTINDESRTNPAATTTAANGDMCPSDDPLVFTATEQAQLANLLNQYYAIAPELKTDNDLSLLQGNITTDQALISQAANLTAQCTAQKADPSYTGPQYVKENPYYQSSNNDPSYFGNQVFTEATGVATGASPTPNPTGNQSYGYFEQQLNIW